MENKHKEFKPFDKILVRNNSIWQADLYSFYEREKNLHATISKCVFINDDNILPYEGNETLVGTIDEPEVEVKLGMGECIMVANEPNASKCEWLLREVIGIDDETECLTVDSQDIPHPRWKYAISFSDFNPNDWKETKKNILCVKNGKVVRYKE